MSGASTLLPLPAALAAVLATAHFWRAGQHALSALCLVLALLSWTRGAWVRRILLLVLPLLAARWIWVTGQFVQLRQFMDQPWHRLAAILLGVALFTALAALPLLGRKGRVRYSAGMGATDAQTGALGFTLAILGPLYAFMPHFFVLERLLPGWGLLQVFLPGLWAAWVAGKLGDTCAAPKIRLLVWRLFSVVFFSQLLLGLTFESRFLLSGQLHLPVPGLIAAAPIYRGGGWFMLILFGVSVLLAGAAWCSHLCYFGVWDATAAAKRKQPAQAAPAWLPRLRLAILGLTLLTPLFLRRGGAPLEAALACGLLLGLALIPCALFFSRRLGYSVYCQGLCPLGQLASWLGRLAPWRVRRTRSCTGCLACVRACRQGAMTRQSLATGAAGPACTLCRDCLAVCRENALSLCCWTRKWHGAAVESAFIAVLAGLHAVFLALARV